jgi:hypothetical protein
LWWCCCVCLLKAFHLEVNTEKKKKKSRVTSLSLHRVYIWHAWRDSQHRRLA